MSFFRVSEQGGRALRKLREQNGTRGHAVLSPQSQAASSCLISSSKAFAMAHGSGV